MSIILNCPGSSCLK